MALLPVLDDPEYKAFLAQYQLPDEERKRLLLGNMLLGLGGGLMNARRGNELGAAGSGAVQGAQLAQSAIADARKGRLEQFGMAEHAQKMKAALDAARRNQDFAGSLMGASQPATPVEGLPQIRPGALASVEQPKAAPQGGMREYLLSIGVPEQAIAVAAQSAAPQEAVQKLIDHYNKPEFGSGKIPLLRTAGGGFRASVPQGMNEALAAQTAAETGASEAAKAQYDMVSVPQADGTSRMMTRAQAARAFGGGQAPAGAGLGVTQNPADVKRADAALAVQTEQEKKIAGGQAEEFMSILKSERDAPNTIGKLTMLKNHLANVETGKAAPLTQSLKAYAAYFAPDLAKNLTKDTPYAQAAEALSNELALQLRNPAGGAGMPGSLSDSDRNFLVSMTANVSNDPRAIPIMIDARIALEKRAQDIGKIARDYKRTNGKIDDGFYAAVADFAAREPLFAGQEPPKPTAKAIPDRSAIEAEMRRRKLL